MIGGRAVWLLPTSFVAAMLLGYVLAIGGVAIPFVEPAILGSVFVLGALVVTRVRLAPSHGALLVAAFGVFHGAAHGGEMDTQNVILFGLGFTVSTALLHMAGIAINMMSRSSVIAELLTRQD